MSFLLRADVCLPRELISLSMHVSVASSWAPTRRDEKRRRAGALLILISTTRQNVSAATFRASFRARQATTPQKLRYWLYLPRLFDMTYEPAAGRTRAEMPPRARQDFAKRAT